MKFSNVVRFKAKPGKFDTLVDILSQSREFEGMLQSILVKTGEDTACSIGIWESEAAIVNARPQMIALLDTMRDHLETLSDELGVTDPVSGPIIHET